MLFRDSVDAIVKKSGNNALTRRRYSPQLASTTNFNAERHVGHDDQRRPSASPTPCFLVNAGQERRGSPRVYPTAPGTFDCNKSERDKRQGQPDHRAVPADRPAVRPAPSPPMGSGRTARVAVEGRPDHRSGHRDQLFLLRIQCDGGHSRAPLLLASPRGL